MPSFTSVRHHVRMSFVALLATMLTGLAGTGPAEAASPTATLGVYRGSGAPDQVASFERWNGGQQAHFALDFLPSDSWSSISHPAWAAERWQHASQQVIYSIPLLPASGATLARGAAGDYDSHFAAMARTLVAHGQSHAILRLGWEFNGDWFTWAASRNPDAFVAYWRRVVTAIRGVPGAAFTIDWAPVIGKGGIAPDRVYPGDAYVDVIGLDVYDQDWSPGRDDPNTRWKTYMDQPYGLRWHRDFAAAHNKAMSFPEWGLTVRPDGHGGGDNAVFIERMHEWIAANDVLYHCYFEFDAPDGSHRMMGGRFPLGSAAFRRLFVGTGDQGTPGPAGSSTRPRIRLTGVRAIPALGRLRVSGHVRRALAGGRVRVQLRARGPRGWRVVDARSGGVGAAGRFAVVLRRPSAGPIRLVARFRGADGSRAKATLARTAR
jgi:hypothetical protein